MKNICFFALMLSVVFLSGCKKKYYDIDQKEKNVFLYNAYNVGDTFRMIRISKSNCDTVTFTVVQKDIQYVKRYKSFNKYDQYYILAFTCKKTDNLQLYHSGGVYFTRDDTALFLNELTVRSLIAEDDTITVNSKYYDHLYKLSDNNHTTFALISEQDGIVKMWTNYLTYELLP